MGTSFGKNDLLAGKYNKEQGQRLKTINISINKTLGDYEGMSLFMFMGIIEIPIEISFNKDIKIPEKIMILKS